MAYDLKYDKLLRAIECGRQNEAVALFERRLFDANERIRYLFEDGKRFTVTPLYWAVRHNCPSVCRYLLRNGARPYGTVVYEYYPLHEACSRGYDKVVQEFVGAGCELDKVNHDADTPLHVACMRGHIQCVHILLRAGSDCSLRNSLGHTPLQSAVYHDRNDLVELFKAHNKGIETTPPVGSAHQKHSAVSTLTATSGVRVQRSHSFNAAGSVAGVTSGNHSQKRTGGQSRVRASQVRPQSYYENGASSLVIGQTPLNSFTSQSMQSLSATSSSCLSSYSTISTHVPTSTYSTLSPDSPVELDAPKRPPTDPSPPAHSIGIPQNLKDDQPKSSPACPYSKPVEDFGTKHGTGFILSDGPLKPAEGGRELSAGFQTPCPFPSPGGQKTEHSERRLSPTKHAHPLSASTRSDHHRHHGDKLLQERLSHPEFSVTKRDIHIANRAKSSNDVLLGKSDHHPVPSPTREYVDRLARSLCSSLDLHPLSGPQHLHHSSPPPPLLHPLLQALRASLSTQAHRFGLSPDHHKSLSDLLLAPPPFPSLDPAPSPSSSLCTSAAHQPSFQEVDFEVVEGPLERRVWLEEGAGREAFATLLLKVQVCDPLVQLRSQMNQGDIVLLKVKVRLESDAGSLGPSSSLGLLTDHLPEVTLLQSLPPHPHIASVLYHCRGRTEKFREYLSHGVVSRHLSRLGSTSLREESHSRTADRTRGLEDQARYGPASTGTFLFQSAPGVPLEKYFSEFLQTEKRETAVENRFLQILAQLLLAVAHLQKNLVSHCAISSRSVYISENGGRVVLGDFGQAMGLRPNNLDVFRKSVRQLRASKTRKLSPEAEQGLTSCETETVSSHVVQSLEESFSKSDSYAVGALFYDLLSPSLSSASETPFLHHLSFRCNHLLQKLVARDPAERFSAIQGAVSCLVLLFGPQMADIAGPRDCLQWLVSESLEVYLNPVLRDSAIGSRDGGCRRRLHYSYLVSASPELVYDSCRFFSDD